jgi:hypothetical protein
MVVNCAIGGEERSTVNEAMYHSVCADGTEVNDDYAV